MSKHPRDRYITVYGRKPVLEVLEASDLEVARVLVARGARGGVVDQIRKAARRRGVEVIDKTAVEVSRISRRPKQDQGVAADVEAPRMGALEDWLSEDRNESCVLLALDGVTTPANVGMILRTATVLGLGGVVLARRGSPEIGPLVIKASAGYAFRARILRCAVIEEGLAGLRAAGFTVYGLSDRGDAILGEAPLATRAVLLLGNETEGVVAAKDQVDAWLRIPTASEGDSLNVASAAAIAAWTATRR
ncbi:MAG: RNA methyltransferase [Myxococcales bacterium]|nr:RNA methyltransferase [Myxococcales bacterium]